MGNDTARTINCNGRIGATLCTIKTGVFFRYIIISTLHKDGK